MMGDSMALVGLTSESLQGVGLEACVGLCSGGGFGGEDSSEGVAKSSSVVAPEGPFGWGSRYDVGAVDGRISEKGFVRGRERVSKTF